MTAPVGRSDSSKPVADAKELSSSDLRGLARDGVAAARSGDFESGHRMLGDLCDRLRRVGEKVPARVVSYYGLCLALHLGKHREAAELCQAAIDTEPMKADYYANLAEVCASGRQRRKAVSAVGRGLAIDATNTRLVDLQARLGTRRAPVVSSLERSHPVNVTLGRIRHAFTGPAQPEDVKNDKKQR